ncbi:MAG: VOC family protein [Blautia massiliensis (ex Durand et al. 2017)]
MVGRIYHVGLTVSDLERSIAFYRDVLGLEFQGEIFMEGEETDKMFRRVNCKARVAYLNGSKAVEAPPVELIQFVNNEVKKVPLICLQHLSRKYVSTQMILILLTNIS